MHITIYTIFIHALFLSPGEMTGHCHNLIHPQKTANMSLVCKMYLFRADNLHLTLIHAIDKVTSVWNTERISTTYRSIFFCYMYSTCKTFNSLMFTCFAWILLLQFSYSFFMDIGKYLKRLSVNDPLWKFHVYLYSFMHSLGYCPFIKLFDPLLEIAESKIKTCFNSSWKENVRFFPWLSQQETV